MSDTVTPTPNTDTAPTKAQIMSLIDKHMAGKPDQPQDPDKEPDAITEPYSVSMPKNNETYLPDDLVEDDEPYDDNFLTSEIKTEPEIVEGFITERSLNNIVAGAKCYKSWHSLRLALCVAHGISWMGRKTIKSRVLYLNPEVQKGFFRKRVQALMKELNIERIDNDFFKTKSLRRKQTDPEQLLKHIEHRATEADLGLIVFDSIYKFYTHKTDENSNSSMAILLNRLDAIGGRAAVIYSAHTPKGNQKGKDVIDMAAGGAHGRIVDASLGIRKEPDNTYKVEFSLRNFAIPNIAKIYCNGAKLQILDSNVQENEQKKTIQMFLTIMKDKWLKAGEIQKQFMEQSGFKVTQTKQYWELVKDADGVRADDATKKQCKWTYEEPTTMTKISHTPIRSHLPSDKVSLN